MTVRELVKMVYLKNDQNVELYDYNVDEKGGYDIMLPPMVWGSFDCNVVKETKIDPSWQYYRDKKVVYFSFKENTLYICIDYENKRGFIEQ